MNFQEIADNIKEQATKTAPLGGTFKLVLDDNVIFIDGSGTENLVSFDDREADTEISTSIDSMTAMISGDLNPMMATMTGKVKIKGNMGLAMKLQSFL
jgi:putative sterol carrier protein